MTTIGVIGAGAIGSAFARAAASKGISVILSKLDLEEDGAKLFAAFFQADFDAVLVFAMAFWDQNGDLTDAGSSRRILEEDKDDRLSWYFTVELIRALGLFADSIRRGDDSRLSKAAAKLKALDESIAARRREEEAERLRAALGTRVSLNRNANGAGNGGLFMVGNTPEILEDESLRTPQQLPDFPVTVSGRLKRIEEVDRYQFKDKKSELITCDLFARR